MTKQRAFYNNNSGLGIGPLPGPYGYRGDITIFPLRANQDSVQRFVDRYINEIGLPEWLKFYADWDWVFLYVAEIELEQGDTKLGAEKYTSLFFRIPVFVPNTLQQDGEEIAFLEVFSFIDSIPAVLTSRESRGLNSRYAQIGLPSVEGLVPGLNSDSVRRFGHVYNPSDPVRIENLRPLPSAPPPKSIDSISLLAMVTKVSDEIGVSTEARDEVLLLIRSLNSSDAVQRDEKPEANLKTILERLQEVKYENKFDPILQRRVVTEVGKPSEQANPSEQTKPPSKPEKSDKSDRKFVRNSHLAAIKQAKELKEAGETDTAQADKEIKKAEDSYRDQELAWKLADEQQIFSEVFEGLLGRYVQRVYTIKQFSDASDSKKASYQALLRIEHFFTGEPDGEKAAKVQISDAGCMVRVYDYASHPINTIFQFPPAYRLRPSSNVSEIYCGCPIYVRGIKAVEERGLTLFYRSQDGDWFDTGRYNT